MVRFVKKYLVLMVVAVLFVGAFLLNLKTNAAKTGSGEGEAFKPAEEAQEAERLGCTYITAGHIFATDCKKGVPPRGLEFLRAVCAAVSVPVYASGGISDENIAAVRACGAAGACVMSGAMQCEDPAAYFESFEKAGERNDLSC